MATKIKDRATAEIAAQKLNTGVETQDKPGEPKAPEQKTTAERLFPEFVTDDGGIVNRPIKPYEDASKVLPASATPVVEPQGQTPPNQTPTVPVYLKPEELTGKMVKLKVDGIEQDVPAESLIKTNQLERHLNAQLMNLAEERRKLDIERTTLLQRAAIPVPEPPKKGEPPVKKTPEVEALEIRILQMQSMMENLQTSLVPQIQEAGIKRVEKMVKDRIGSDDFRNYFDKIRDSALEEAAKPEVSSNPQARAYFDSDAYYFQKYQEMKLKELMTKPSSPTPNQSTPALVTQQGTPVIMNNQGEPRSLPAFESSGGVPSRSSSDSNWATRAQQAFDTARQTGNTEDWMAYYKLKAQGS